MKKIFPILLIIGFLAITPSLIIAADDPTYNVPNVNVMGALDSITNWLFTILLVIAVIAIIVAGLLFVLAQGNPESIEKARTFVMYALIGVAVAFLARGLLFLVDRIVNVP